MTERDFQKLVDQVAKATTPLELERSAAYQAGSYGLEWDDLPEKSFWGHSKEKFRRAALEGKAQLLKINQRFDRAYEMSRNVKLPSDHRKGQ